MSFRLRLTLFGATLVFLTLLAFGWLVYELAANSQANAQDEALKQRAADALTSVSTAPAGELNGTVTPSLSGAEDLRRRTDPFTEVVTSSGTVLSSTGRVGSAAPAVPPTVLAAAVNGGALATVDASGSAGCPSPAAAGRLPDRRCRASSDRERRGPVGAHEPVRVPPGRRGQRRPRSLPDGGRAGRWWQPWDRHRPPGSAGRPRSRPYIVPALHKDAVRSPNLVDIV